MPKWYPIGSYSFRVVIGNRKIGFSRVSGISLMKDKEDYTSLTVLRPGCPDVTRVPGVEVDDERIFESMTASKNRHRKVLMLEKALQPKKSDSNQEFLLSLMENNVNIKEVRIEILDASREVAAVLVFQTCCVISYDLSDLDAINGNYVKQTIGIQYQSAVMQPAR